MSPVLRTEAATFGAYFGTIPLAPEIVARYEVALSDELVSTDDRFDEWLVTFAARHRTLTGLADAYARYARPYGRLRRRLTLMLALLETHGATHAAYDRAQSSILAVPGWRLAGRLGWAARTIVATLICGPAHLIMAARAGAQIARGTAPRYRLGASGVHYAQTVLDAGKKSRSWTSVMNDPRRRLRRVIRSAQGASGRSAHIIFSRWRAEYVSIRVLARNRTLPAHKA